MKRILAPFALCSLLVLPALAQDPKPAQEPAAKAERKLGLAKPIEMTAEHEIYGAKLAGKDVATLADVMKDAKAWNGKVVQVRGKITGVCQKKGCWMMLKDGANEMRVGFTGYKFFVPLDVDGKEVAVEGTVNVKTETEAERRHYAHDAGKSPEEIAKIVGDQTTVSFTADAVQIGKLPPLPKKEGCCGETGACTGCEAEKGCTDEKKPAGTEKPKGDG